MPENKRNEDSSKAMVRNFLRVATQINLLFVKFVGCLQLLLLPQLRPYTRRVYVVFILQMIAHEMTLVMCAKVLTTFFYFENYMLLLAVGSFIPFCSVVFHVWSYLPCPPITEYVSNAALLVALFTITLVGGAGSQQGPWGIYMLVMAIWPWMVLAALMSRLHVERIGNRNPFSPIRDLPVLGFASALALVFMLMAAKSITITDMVVLSFFDPILCASLAPIAFGKYRIHFHSKYFKVYAVLASLVYLYLMDSEKEAVFAGITEGHVLFVAGRFLLVFRSMWAKKAYSDFYHSSPPPRPPETELLFFNNSPPHKHRFGKFPAPTLLILDCIFDSGLRDMDFHGMGPLGTLDLHNLTELAYILPVASIAGILYESGTLKQGFLGGLTTYSAGKTKTAVQSASDAATSDGNTGVSSIADTTASEYTLGVLAVAALFCLARYLSPHAASKALFDKGSSMHSWKYQPALFLIGFFFIDVLWVNEKVTKDDIILVFVIAGAFCYYRDQLWSTFRRKQWLYLTQELQYYQPSCCRELQKKTLLEFMKKTSAEDYGMMLIETAIRHGQNVREIARDVDMKVWDPSPTATAAWKLALSLVTKSLKINNIRKRKKDDIKSEIQDWIGRLVVDMVYKAVDDASGHGSRLRHAGALASMFSKRRAVHQLRRLAERRRQLRQKRRNGQMTLAVGHLATTNGCLRDVRDINPQAPPKGVPQLPPPPRSKTGGVGASTIGNPGATLALAPTTSNGRPGDGQMALPGHLPGHLPAAAMSRRGSGAGDSGDEEGGERPRSAASSRGVRRPVASQVPRGVWSLAGSVEGGGAQAPGGSVVIAFGDGLRGQLGVDPAAAQRARRGTLSIVEELRGYDPVQVEASGVASFVLLGRGYLFAFGSNRCMELGLRKEVTQVCSAQRVKNLREHELVQVASSKAASGQAHTLALTTRGHVYSFGTSSSGALGQGPDVRQTAPIMLRMTQDQPVRLVVCGAHHSLLVTDTGRLFTFGDNSYGQLGFGAARAKTQKYAPEPVPLDEWTQEAGPVRILAAGNNHNVALAAGGLYAWGANANGQLGLGRLGDQAAPQEVRDLKGLAITSLACGAQHSLAVARKGTQVWVWGSNVQGQLGVGQESPADGQHRHSPSICQALSGRQGMEIVQVAAAACHSLALTKIGEVYTFGDNSCGQLGFSPEGSARGPAFAGATRAAKERDNPRAHGEGLTRLWKPERVVGLSMYNVRSISTAEMHSAVLAA